MHEGRPFVLPTKQTDAENLIHEKDSYVFEKFGPESPTVDPGEDFEFFQFENEYHTKTGYGLGVNQYGRSPEGASVLIRSTGFKPHFSIKHNPSWSHRNMFTFHNALEDNLRKRVGRTGDAKLYHKLVCNITPYDGKDLMSYNGEDPESFFKIEVAYPQLVKHCRILLEYPRGKPKTKYIPAVPDWWPEGVPPLISDIERDFPTYESNVDFMLRFQVDHKIKATGWVKLAKGKYRVLPKDCAERMSCSEIEIVCDHSAIGYSPRPSTEVPKYVVYSWDTEEETGPNHEFPKAKTERDKLGNVTRESQRIIQAGFLKVLVSPETTKTSQGIHLIGDTAKIKDADEVYAYTNELNLLRGLHGDIKATDPDFVVDFNGSNHDLPYWYNRTQENGIYASFGDLGRINGLSSRCYNSSFNSSAHKTEKMVTTMNGRAHVDVFQCIKREKKLRSYGLNAVSQEYLKRGKIEMDYNKINELQKTPEGRAVLGYYCIVDSILPWELIIQLKMITSYIQMAYVAGVSVQQLLDRGQQIRMLAQVYHYAKDTAKDPVPDGYDFSKRILHPYVIPVFPTYKKWPLDKFMGAVVVEAQTGFHDWPVTTLDFASLYPSIIIANNFCWSTYCDEFTIKKFRLIENVHYKRMPDCRVNDDEYKSVTEIYNPKNPCFLLPDATCTQELIDKHNLEEGIHYVRKTVDGHEVFRLVACKKGIMPTLLEGLLAKRKEVRKKAEGQTDKALLANIDALQLAYKVMANSMYGATGTGEKGYLPLRAVAESVTREGRRMILTVAWKVREKYNKKNGYPYNANIIYGDTDSVFVEFADPEAPLKLPDGKKWSLQINKDLLFEAGYDFDLVKDDSLDMASYVTQFFLKPISMTYEKSFNGILLVSKKRYAGLKIVWTVDEEASFATGYKNPVYNQDGSINEVASKKGGWLKTIYKVHKGDSKFSATGLENVRRDSCPLVSEMVDKILKTVIVKHDVPGAVKYARDEISKLLQGKQSYAKLIITRALSRKAEDYSTKLAHVELAERQKKRDPGTAPNIGDRIKYVKIPGTKSQKAYELAEDPLYAFEHNMALDYDWYMSNQLKKPLQRIFYFVFKNLNVTRDLASMEQDADWIRIHDIFGSGLTDEDVIFAEDLEEDKEDEENERKEYECEKEEFEEFFGKLAVHEECSPDTVMKDQDKDDPPPDAMVIEPKPALSNKRKQADISSMYGSKGTSQPKAETRYKGNVSEKSRKALDDARIKRQKKEQESAMEHSVANSIIFGGDHTRKRVQKASTAPGSISGFYKVSTTCQVCNTPTGTHDKAICGKCSDKKLEARIRSAERRDDALIEVKKCLSICELCVKNNPSIDLQSCRNTDCPNLWDRMVAAKGLSKEDAIKILDW